MAKTKAAPAPPPVVKPAPVPPAGPPASGPRPGMMTPSSSQVAVVTAPDDVEVVERDDEPEVGRWLEQTLTDGASWALNRR